MLLALLLLVPVGAGLVALLLRSGSGVLIVGPALVHLALTIAVCFGGWEPAPDAWFGLDAVSELFLLVTSVLYMAVSIYTAGYLHAEDMADRRDAIQGLPFRNVPKAVFVACLGAFMSSMTLVIVSRHLGLLWVGIEATTLASAPLIYFHRHRRSLEATWKYLILCSVGIALALVGNMFIAVGMPGAGEGTVSLVLPDVLAAAPAMDPRWVELGFVFLLVGFGTKVGLAPLHTWLPDAHSEAPSPVSALLSGALLNCAFLGIWRGLEVVSAAGRGEFGRSALLVLGVASVVYAGALLLGQRDYKRLLAYSSVENLGLVAVAVALGGTGTSAGLLHAVNHSLIKAALFLAAGAILTLYKTTEVREVSGLRSVSPALAAVWIAGLLAILGAPPFGTFATKFAILAAALERGGPFVLAALLVGLTLAFIGIVTAAFPMAQGEAMPRRKVPAWAIASPVVLLSLALLLGIAVPDPIADLVAVAAGGGP